MKFIFEYVTEENHEECEEGRQRVVQKLCTRSVKFVLKIFTEENQNKYDHSWERLTLKWF